LLTVIACSFRTKRVADAHLRVITPRAYLSPHGKAASRTPAGGRDVNATPVGLVVWSVTEQLALEAADVS
jgi:DUF971 family protein